MSDPIEQSGAGGAKSFLTAQTILKTKLYSKALKRTATQAPHPSETMAPGGRPLPRPAAGSSLGAWGALPLQHTAGEERCAQSVGGPWGPGPCGGAGVPGGGWYLWPPTIPAGRVALCTRSPWLHALLPAGRGITPGPARPLGRPLSSSPHGGNDLWAPVFLSRGL